MKLSVHDILAATGGRLISGYPATVCTGASIDTRTLQAGNVFYALRGPRFDGHAFLETASRKRAQAMIVERLDAELRWDADGTSDVIAVSDTLRALQATAQYIRKKTKNTTFIGLTGSNGKTTTKEMLASILRLAGKTLSTRGNLNNHIGLPLMLHELEDDHQYALLELGTSKPGDMDVLVDLLHPQVALITNVGKDHLEYLGTPEGVLKENRKLYDTLPKEGVAVINLDDPLIRESYASLTCRIVTYSQSRSADVTAKDIKTFPAPLRFTLQIGKEQHVVQLQTIGELQVANALAAASVAHALGLPPATIVKGLEAFRAPAMRMETRTLLGGAITVNDAYNANPSSVRASIASFCQSFQDRPRWIVLGDMRELGAIARQEHRELGEWIAGQPVDRVFLYGRDSRFIEENLRKQSFRGTVERYKKKRYLIDVLKRALAAPLQPAILFKASRRMQLEQVIHALSSIPS